MSRYDPHLHWIDSQRERMCRLVSEWANINSGSYNVAGLQRLSEKLKVAFASLGGEVTEIPLNPHRVIGADGSPEFKSLGKAIRIRKRRSAPLRVFLGIHMDTVYGEGHPFQKVAQIDANTLGGPGVVDAKGGLAVMLTALEALERSPFADAVGWEILINPDEELGSPGSAPILANCAAENDLGMVFEPTLPDGALVSSRKGSGNFAAIVRGKSAHVGRDFANGRNALLAAAEFAVAVSRLSQTLPGVIVNVGRIDGGGPLNVVPDLAICRFNVRVDTADDHHRVEAQLQTIAAEFGQREGLNVALEGEFLSPPKMLDDPTRKLLEAIAGCGDKLGLSIQWRPSGGASDGNKLAAAGLPVVDTFGPRGGNLHSPEEYLLLDSLTERAKLAALLLMKLGSGEIDWKPLSPLPLGGEGEGET